MKRRNISYRGVLLFLALIFAGVLFLTSRDAHAADYQVKVGNIRVSDDNKDDVLGDGGSVRYEPASGGSPARLILHNALIQNADQWDPGSGNIHCSGISSWENLVIELIGDNKIVLPKQPDDSSKPNFFICHGIFAEFSPCLAIEGSGSLEIITSNAEGSSYGIIAKGYLYLRDNAEVKISINEEKSMERAHFCGIQIRQDVSGRATLRVLNAANLEMRGPCDAGEPFKGMKFIKAKDAEIQDQVEIYLYQALAEEFITGLEIENVKISEAAKLRMDEIGNAKKF